MAQKILEQSASHWITGQTAVLKDIKFEGFRGKRQTRGRASAGIEKKDR